MVFLRLVLYLKMWFSKSFSPNFNSISTFVNQLEKIKIDVQSFLLDLLEVSLIVMYGAGGG